MENAKEVYKIMKNKGLRVDEQRHILEQISKKIQFEQETLSEGTSRGRYWCNIF